MENDFQLGRFVEAQAGAYADAVEELRAGRKRTHWMWFIFPQIAGLGSSAIARHFAIRSLDEARAYLAHPVLGARLRECAEFVNRIEGISAHDIFGSPDDLKFRSCMTLFAQAEPAERVFRQVLEKFFGGEADRLTLERLFQPHH
jgi:uncharacterized protein (DUF1810 family)